MFIHEIRKWLIPATNPIEQDYIDRTLALDELSQYINTMSDMGRVLCIWVVAENGEIIVLVGDLLTQHIQTMQQVEHLGLGEVGIRPKSKLIRHSHCNRRILPKFADLVRRDQDGEDTRADPEPLIVGIVALRHTKDRGWLTIVQ